MSSFFKKTIFILVFSLVTHFASAQAFGFRPSSGKGAFEGRFGVTAGMTNYIVETNMLFSKSQPGFGLGVIGTASFDDNNRFELLVEINYTRNFATFIGRENPEAAPEDIKFHMDNLNIPFILHYRFLNLKDDWHFAASAGPSVSFFHNFKLSDDSKSEYLLDPLYVPAKYMEFDTYNEKISFNAFLSFGLSAEYKNFMFRGQYFMGLTDPYRNAPVYSPAASISGEENYYSFSLVYFFGDLE